MRIALATQSFSSLGGSSTYLLTVAEQLERLGHDATILGLELGEMADLARGRGARVVERTDDLGEVDALIAQDAPAALALTAHDARAPLLFVCHGTGRDGMAPPQSPDLASAVVVMNERVRARVEALSAGHAVLRLRQPIDMERFAPRAGPRRHATRALLLGNNLQGTRRAMVREVCEQAGLELVQIGRHGTAEGAPEHAIGEADLVIGYGRCVLEAMACGRPAYVYDHLGGDGWVTPDNFAELEADGFGGRATDAVIDRERLRADLLAYDVEMGLANRDLVVHAHDAGRHAQALVAAFQEAGARHVPAAPLDEIARLVRLQWQTDARAGIATTELEHVEERAAYLSGVIHELHEEMAAFRSTRRFKAVAALSRPLDRLRGRGNGKPD